jgi:hypothetical protein
MLQQTTHQRSAAPTAATDTPRRSITIRAGTADDQHRVIEAVLATPDRVAVLDSFGGGIIEEVLLPDGMSSADRVPMLDGHRAQGTDHLRGSVTGIRADRGRVSGTLEFGSDDESKRAFQLAADGHLSHTSVGYSVIEATDIAPGDTKTVQGQRYTAGERTLRISTRWQLREVSLVAIPADQNAKIGSRSAPYPTSTRRRQASEQRKAALIEGMMIRAGVLPAESASPQATDWSRRSLVDVARECLRIEGVDAPADPEYMMGRALSTATFADVLGDAGEGAFLAALDRVQDTTRVWVGTTDLPNFKPNNRYQVNPHQQLNRVPRGGAAEHAHFDQQSAAVHQLHRYARQFTASEQDLADDQLGAIREGVTGLADMALNTKLDVVYAVLLSNPNTPDGTALFHSDHNNLASDSLTLDNMAKAVQAIREQRINGQPAGLIPRALIIPPALEGQSRQIMHEWTHQNGEPLAIVVDSRLGSAGVVDPLTGTSYTGSDTEWYVATAGARGIEVGFLDGQRQPQLRNWTMDKDGQFGMGWDVHYDLSAVAVDYRGLYKGAP